ncbi:MAG: 3'-5' exonuclease [Candidatus Aminicenantales bacterium]
MPTQQPRFFLFDCETTGLPRTRYFSPHDVDAWPRLVQVAWGCYDSDGNAGEAACHIIRPEGFRIPADATKIHGITQARALRAGRDLGEVLDEFLEASEKPGIVLVAHNLAYDFGVIGAELVRVGKPLRFLDIPGICTMKSTTEICRLPRPGGFGFKWPTLEELHVHLFGRAYAGAHDAARDLEACARSFFRLWQAGHYPSL